jgi:hypothetical protein
MSYHVSQHRRLENEMLSEIISNVYQTRDGKTRRIGVIETTNSLYQKHSRLAFIEIKVKEIQSEDNQEA